MDFRILFSIAMCIYLLSCAESYDKNFATKINVTNYQDSSINVLVVAYSTSTEAQTGPLLIKVEPGESTKIKYGWQCHNYCGTTQPWSFNVDVQTSETECLNYSDSGSCADECRDMSFDLICKDNDCEISEKELKKTKSKTCYRFEQVQ